MKTRKNNTIGILILGIGILVLMRNLGLIDVVNHSFSFILSLFWPMLLILIGLKRLRNGKDKSFLTYALIGLGVGILLQDITNKIPTLGHIFQFIIPALIILVGIILIFKPSTVKRFAPPKFSDAYNENANFEHYDFDDSVDYHNDYSYTYQNEKDKLFGEKKHKQTKKDFHDNVFNSGTPKKYRRINNRFISSNYTLREEDIIEGDSYIEINTTMGETSLILPKTVNIKMNGSVSIGEIKFISKLYDGLSSHPKAKYTAPNNATKTLHIQANVSVGEIYILLR